MITSNSNTKIKQVYQLQQQSKERKKTGLFVVEGSKFLQEVPKELIEEIYVTPEYYLAMKPTDWSHIKVEQVSEQVLKHISTVVSPQGILAVVKQQKKELKQLHLGHQPIIVMIENIQDPGNLGTIIRTAEAVAASAVILSKGCVELHNPKVIRSTMGSIFRLPIIEDIELTEAIMWLKEKQIKIYAAHLGGAKNYFEVDYKQPSCFLIGNEGNGLTEEVAALASEHIKIPMPGLAESLNASIATGVLLYEALRQRSYSVELF